VTSPRPVALHLLIVYAATTALSAQPQVPTMPGYPAPGAPVDVTLVAPGAAPRRALRYTVARGAKSTVEISQSVTNVMHLAGVSMSMPPTIMVIDLRVTDVATSGDITFGMTFTDARAGAAGPDESVAALMAMGLALLKGLGGTGTITSRGITKSMKMNLDRIEDPAVRASLEQSATIEYLFTPLPEAAVGVGAKWEIRETVEKDGLTMFKRSEYELVRLDAARATITVKTGQTAPPQSASKPGTPAAEQARLEKLTGSGSGTTTVRFAALAAPTTMDSTISLVMGLNVDGKTESLTSDIRSKITMTVK